MVSRNSRYDVDYESYQRFVSGKPLNFKHIYSIIKGIPFSFLEMLIRYIPGGVGFKVRYYYYKFFFSKMGKNVLIDVGVYISGARNVSVSDYAWIDNGVIISAMVGEISIGRRVHIGPYTIIAAREPVILEDYVGLSSGVRVYAVSEHPMDGKRMSGPMLPEEYRAFYTAPVTLRKDSFVGTNAVILPGVELGQGAVVAAGSVVSKSVEPYQIVTTGGKKLGERSPVTVPDV